MKSTKCISELELKVKKLKEGFKQSHKIVVKKSQEIAKLEAKASNLEDDLKKSEKSISLQAQENIKILTELESEKKLAKENIDRCKSKLIQISSMKIKKT